MFMRPALRALPAALSLFGIASCYQDTRPLDDCVRDALDHRLEQYDVKGASVAIVFPNGFTHRICAGFSHDSIPMQPGMLVVTGIPCTEHVPPGCWRTLWKS